MCLVNAFVTFHLNIEEGVKCYICMQCIHVAFDCVLCSRVRVSLRGI